MTEQDDTTQDDTTHQDHTSADDQPDDMQQADAANGEPHALDQADRTEQDGSPPKEPKPAVGERQAAENRAEDPPG